MVGIDTPVLLGAEETRITMRGWCNDRVRPEFVVIRIAGTALTASIKPAPHVDEQYPELKAVAYECDIDFAEIYRKPEARFSKDLFAVVVVIDCGSQQRGFEYAVSQEWVNHVFAGREVPHPKPPTPDHLMIRVSGSCDISFYPTGHIALGQIRDLLTDCGESIEKFKSILDFGCGCGRVILALHNEGIPASLYGSDIDKETIEWCQENFGCVAKFDWNETAPPTRYADNTFDLVYAISVFTHLPEDHQFAWLAELRRIIKPGGLLITTVHGPTTCGQLPQQVQAAVRQRGFLYIDQTQKDWPSYLGAKTDGLPDFYRLTYHTFEYVRSQWSDYFTIINIKEQGRNFMQDAVVCRKE
jgi:SAM-dependent methyltransferase